MAYRVILDFILCDFTKSLNKFFWFNDDDIVLTLLLNLRFYFYVYSSCFFIYGVTNLIDYRDLFKFYLLSCDVYLKYGFVFYKRTNSFKFYLLI